MKKNISIVIAAFAGLLSLNANATIIDCVDTSINHMSIDDTQVASCVDSGFGNIGNGPNDDFLDSLNSEGDGYYLLVENYSGWVQTGDTSTSSVGTWSIDAMYQDAVDAIGFKFGTGTDPDNWFVFDLIDGVFSGDWAFSDITVAGGQGLSHMVLYTKDSSQEVPEPSMVGLLALGLIGVAVARRRMKV